MQLFHSGTSPYVRKITILLHEIGQLDAVELVPSGGSPFDPSQMPLAHNPLGKVPTLARPDGPALFDSRVICRYLDSHFTAGLYPEARIWEVLTLEALADGMLDAALLMVYEGRARPEDKQFPDWVEAQWTKIARALDMLEERWLSHLAGPLDMSQIAVAGALGYLDFRHSDRNWRQGHDGLTTWFADFAARPALQATLPG